MSLLFLIPPQKYKKKQKFLADTRKKHTHLPNLLAGVCRPSAEGRSGQCRPDDKHQERLHNRHLQMTVRVSEANEHIRAYSQVERFQLMSQKNPHLMKLKEAFGLELG